ncbi:hypothetical protein SAY86_029429 [Trapa natans]|uniref:Clu domain-containing protein n=1 Tax=Trapa natans TaxID=22666 RepID=A0AAN7RHC2_TRANT|nr:hypothetical protein SAY86_029429 [Trapa natans]
MAPRNNRGKAKGEKKKKEEKVLPVVVDIAVNLPDESRVVLKGISTDRIIDVRRLLCVNTETCAITNFSLSHEVRGALLKDTVDVSTLKPCVLTLVEGEYDEERAVEHVRRLLDIVACTTCFGSSASTEELPKADAAADKPAKTANKVRDAGDQSPPPKLSKDAPVDGDGDVNYSPPKLGSFYEFFSISHLTPPLQYIRKVVKRHVEEISPEDHLFSFDVKLCNGKLVHVESCKRGFYNVGKQRFLCHNLVDLLRHNSRAFDNAYDELMKAFMERNKFGNLPYGFRANTWLIPPVAAQSPSVFPPLPVEDERWGGNGGGLGRDGKSNLLPWADEFLFLATMPCKTAEERQVRDRSAFILHSLFVDVAIFRAVSAVQHVLRDPTLIIENGKKSLYSERVGDLKITVAKDPCDASCKVDTKIDGFQATGVGSKDLVVRNLLKGITADENTAAHDVSTLGIVHVRYSGYVATVKVERSTDGKVVRTSSFTNLLDQPEGGANALNINSLRLPLQTKAVPVHNKSVQHLHLHEQEEIHTSSVLVEKLLEDSLAQLEKEEEEERSQLVRWELGACWIQHLQDQRNAEKDKKTADEKNKNAMKVEGLGKPLRSLKNIKKSSDDNLGKNLVNSKDYANSITAGTENPLSPSRDCDIESITKENELPLKNILPDAAFARLRDSETGLHHKSLQELIDLSEKYYKDVALPKLVADFGSLELSPVDGRTLTDFMHTRGLCMRSLGHVVKLSEKLSHVQSLCIYEMIVRAFKHILRAVISATVDMENMATSVAAALNLMLGAYQHGELHDNHNIHPLVWKWLKLFLLKRYAWDISSLNYKDVRKFAILRGLCHKVGVELIPRDFDMDSPNPFSKADVISLVPVYKQAACSSADGRQLLESSKTALDKGKLEDAVAYGTKALSKLVAVCGPYHRMTAGAYSLLAVVLYHTGDFNQAAIYQQKALDINERELGLDHPDTMKSYGDLAVFYYRLQHTELALKYVKRALYLLHLTCGPSHPNTAATYINVAMMEEGLGNVHVALRYLHKALKCNQRLLGPDHIQTAASYHAIAIALSLMEAYPLSVQHEQTTLQILRAKLGPDDLRTQDAAAWLEYFESKAFEQQEAARNGTKKPDASIASKGHLSVSDLLDYINPNDDAKGKDSAKLRRIYSAKGREKFLKNNEQSPSSIRSTEEISKEAINGEIHSLETGSSSTDTDQETSFMVENSTIIDQETEPELVHVQPPVLDDMAEKKLIAAEKTTASEGLVDGDDGWQPVQRPRSEGSSSRRLKQRRAMIGRIYSYQKKNTNAEASYSPMENSYPSNGYYLVRKRAVPYGTYSDHHNINPTQVTKFGRRIVKAVAYRVKTLPSASNESTSDIPKHSSEVSNSPVDHAVGSVPHKVCSMTSLEKSPSYKDVALAPPGTISKLHAWIPPTDVADSEHDANTGECHENTTEIEAHEDPVATVVEGAAKEDDDTPSDSTIIINEKELVDEKEETLFSDVIEDGHPPRLSENETPELSGSSEVIVVQESLSSGTCEMEPMVASQSHDISSTIAPEVEDLKEKSVILDSNDGRAFPTKKLSASAAPFNPLPTIPRAASVAITMTLPPTPGAIPPGAPWPVNMSLLSGPAGVLPSPTASLRSSSHSPYPSPPPTSNMMHPLPFMYPPFTQPQAVPTNAFPVTSSAFRHNHFAWQCSVNPNMPEFIHGPIWPGCPPVDFSLQSPISEPISNHSLDSEEQPGDSELLSPPPLLPVDIDSVVESKKESNIQTSVTVDSLKQDGWVASENNMENGQVKPLSPEGCLKPEAIRETKGDTERTISIQVRGRRNRKQMLRMPVSLLSRPYGSQSFKAICNRVVRGSESPKTITFPPPEACSATAT